MYLQKSSSGAAVVPCVINGKVVELPESQNFPVIQGSTGETIHYAQSATPEVGVQAVEAAAEAFKTWKKTTVPERRALLLKAADILETKVADLAQREIPETSCDDWWPAFDISWAARFMREVAASIAAASVGTIPHTEIPGSTSLVFREPMGVILVISPWNAPIILSCRGIAAALSAGCTVVFKASELCPWTHQIVLEAFTEAGFPPGVFNKIQCARADAAGLAEAIIAHPELRKVDFVGSAAVGKIIGSTAAKHLKPILLELGDQSPLIILDDADLDAAVQNAVRATTAHHGQICFGTERIIVLEKIADQFTKMLVEGMKAIPSAGHAVTVEGAQKAHKILEEAVADGAEYLVGSSKFTGRSSIEHSILINVKPTSRLAREESFAPSASLFVVKTDEEAVAMANNTEYGLSAAVFTKNYVRGLAVARELDFGQVQINTHTMSVTPNAPTQGFKGSGWGSNGATYGIEEFTFNKHVSLNP